MRSVSRKPLSVLFGVVWLLVLVVFGVSSDEVTFSWLVALILTAISILVIFFLCKYSIRDFWLLLALPLVILHLLFLLALWSWNVI